MKTLSTKRKTIAAALLMSFYAMVGFSQDAGIYRIVSPDVSGNLSSITAYIMTVTLRNYGSTTLTSVPINYSVNGGVTMTGSWIGTLVPGDSVQTLISPPFSVQTGLNTLCVYTSLAGDIDNTNDSTCVTVNALPVAVLPYQTDFEGTPPAGWLVNTPVGNLTQWEWGTPSFGQTNTAHSGLSAYDLDLDSAYMPGTDYLETPYFDFSQANQPQLFFFQNRALDLQTSSDGLRIDYTTDQGITWNVLGSQNDPNAIFWYNTASIPASSLPGWANWSMGWGSSWIKIPALAGASQPVKFRFAYDGVNPFGDGVSIDDFAVAADSLSVSFSSANIFCNGDSGSVDVVVSGGVPPYTYYWSNMATTASNTGLLAGTYSVSVNDAVFQFAYGSYNLTEPPQIVISTSVTPATCAQSNGSASLNVTGGVQPYSYTWGLFPSNTTNTISNVPAGSYTFFVTDSNSCFNSGSVTVGVTTPLNVQQTVSQNPTSCSSACDGIVSLSVSSGTPPYTYSWSNGETTQGVTNLCTGTYSCTVSDASGCIIFVSGFLQSPAFDVIATGTPAGCGMNNGIASANVIGGSPPYAFAWSQGATTQIIPSLTAGIYTVTVTESQGCQAMATILIDDSCHGVWPGDANYDLSVDNSDLLNIGLGYGSTGPIRPSATLNWVAQPCPQWGLSFTSGANYKNADCNGDGVIDDNDTTAIIQNYGLTHPFKPYSLQLPGQPDLTLVVSVDTTGLSDTLNIEAFLGSGAIPVDSIFGLAFTINTDPALVDPNYAAVDFTNCWVGTQGVNLLTLSKNRLTEGAIDLAIVRTDHVNVSGNGAIARTTVVTTDNIAGKGVSPNSALLSFTVSGVKAITNNEIELLLNQGGDSIVIDSAFVQGIMDDHFDQQFTLQPNPSQGVFFITNKGLTNDPELSITSLTGQLILHTTVSQQLTMLDLTNNSAGIYFLTIKSGNRTLNKKLVITR